MFKRSPARIPYILLLAQSRNSSSTKANRLKKSGKTKGKKACKHHKFDILLFDIGSTDYIINDRKWFVEFDFDKGELPVLITGGGFVIPQGRGKAFFRVKTKLNKGYDITLTL